MKRLTVSVLLIICCTILYSQPQDTDPSSLEISRSMFSLSAGYAADLSGGQGYSAFIKSSTFIGESPFYYGFGSLLGVFSNTEESFFETGVLIGYTKDIEGTNLYYDLFLDLLVTGGRITNTTSLYQSEAPALHLGMSLGFPASSDIDGSISIAPVIRPYNQKTGLWDFSRSYINLSLNLNMKSMILGKQIPWEGSYEPSQNKGVNYKQ